MDIDIDKMRSGDVKRPSINTFYFAEDLWKDLDHLGIVQRFKEKEEALKGSRRYNKDLGNVILKVDEYGNVKLNFKDDVAAQLEGWKTLEGMKDGWFLDGNTKRDYGDKYEDDGIWFTPEWGECKGISNIEDFGKGRSCPRDRSFWSCMYSSVWISIRLLTQNSTLSTTLSAICFCVFILLIFHSQHF